ncbi:unnamed protein product [Orchesella dallaii]|uniref:C2H2-type domain-containing protein n=1 Tax=Orchesella dallaii TaxID=48710 RepID=A0ABP1QFE3_9HEXA
MKQSMSGGGGVVTAARLNGGGGATGVTIVYQPQRPSGGLATSNHHNHNQVRLQQHQQINGGSQQQVTFRRFANNMVQVRRVITQQPQQFHQLADLSSSESSGLEATPLAVTKRNNIPTVPANQGHQRILRRIQRTAAGGKGGEDGLDEDDSFADLDVSLVRGDGGADDDDEEELLIDHDEDGDDDGEVEVEGEGRMGEEKSALELNGSGVDSQYLRHVIETQILNRHKTRIKDWDGTKGHMCQSCHETFLSESGLEMHRNRRILHILFFCRYCKRDLSFFNKCRLLQHLRNHRVTPTVSSLQNCIMIRLLPESEYLHFEYEDCTSSSDEEEDGSGGGMSGGGGSGATPPKRLKPNRFRRSKQSESGNNDKDSPDNSPVTARKTPIVTPITPSSTNPTNIVPPLTTSNNSATTSSKFQHRNEQMTVIKSTGNTSSLVLPSPNSESLTLEKKASTPLASPSAPQIRIRNLSQITVSVNEDDTQEEEYEKKQGELKMEPVTTTKMLRPQMVKVPAPTPSSANGRMESASSPVSQGVTGVQKMEYRCYKCDMDFDTASQFFNHLEEAEQVGLSSRSLHRCPTDDIPSWSQCQYVFHTKVFHEKSVPFLCPGCGDESPDYNELMEHVTNDCFYLSQRARYMCASASLHKCSFADRKSVKTEPEIIDHLKKEHSRAVLQCLHCTQGFATENWLLKHLTEAHNIQLDESKGDSEREALINKTTRPLTQCLICNILFPNGSTYLQHVYLNFHVHILYVKMLECQSCFSIFETNEEIMNHRRESDKCRKLDPFQMKICTAELDSSSGTRMGEQMGMSPTPIKIIANPAAMISNSQSPQTTPPPTKHIVKQEPHISSSGSHSQSAVVTVISSSGIRGSPSSQQRSQQQVQHQQQHQQTHHQKQVTTSFQQKNTQKSSQISSKSCANANNASKSHGNANSKKGFDDLLSCQFCERLVVFSSLRKHEDQCSGLSTVAPGFCLTCRLNFGSKKLLARHGLVHIRDGLPICLFCNNRLIRPTHPKSSTPTQLESSYALKKHIYSNHTSKAVKFPFQCMLCDQFCRDKRATEFHIKEHQFRIPNNTPDPDPTPLPTSPEDLSRLLKVRRKATDPRRKAGKVIQVYYCPLCKNREFANCNGLARHLTLVHQKDPTSLNMSLLKKASTARRFVVKGPNSQGVGPGQRIPGGETRSIISNGPTTTSKHPPSTPIAQTTIVKSSTATSTPTPSRFTSTITLRKRIGSTTVITRSKPVAAPQRQAPVTRQRSLITSSSSSRPSPQTRSSSAATTPSSSHGSRARRKDGTFNCLKCPEFSCKTEKDFCEHIKWKHVWPEHEIQKLQYGNKAGLEEPSEYWCPECDTVFVAKPSLVRHLKFAHDYINSEDYMQKIGYDGKKPLKPNQCEVCYYQCADDRELQQHIRNHGMAFLRLRQQRQQQSANNNSNK